MFVEFTHTHQVNGWGFKRIVSGPDQNSYYNDYFIRGHPELCSKMQRLKGRERKIVSDTSNPKIQPSDGPLSEVAAASAAATKGTPRKTASKQASKAASKVIAKSDKRPKPKIPAIVSIEKSHGPSIPVLLTGTNPATALPTPLSLASKPAPRSSSEPLAPPRYPKDHNRSSRKDQHSRSDSRSQKQLGKTRSFDSLSSCLGSWEDSVEGAQGHGGGTNASSDILGEPLSDVDQMTPTRFVSAAIASGILSHDSREQSNTRLEGPTGTFPNVDSPKAKTDPNQGMTRHSC